MLGLGLASSHAPAIFCAPEDWPTVYRAIPDYMKNSQPHTAKLETIEVIRGYVDRIQKAFGVLRAQLEAYRPDALIMIGDDQGDMFSEGNMPQIAVFTGPEVSGASRPFYVEKPDPKNHIRMPVHQELAKHVLKGLVKQGFDPAHLARQEPAGRPERGFAHYAMYPARSLMPKLDLPIIPILLNEYFPPMPSGQRCWDLGVALSKILADRPERVAIYASGGLTHDPAGPRAGWIDEPLDRWVLERIERNEGESLTKLFEFDSASLRGGSGEIRAWISVAGACRRAGKVVDYFPAHHAKTGIGFAYWPPVEAAHAAVRLAAE
jgi:protocatechuate 4,5-dioxygenase beta chain